MTVRWKPLLVLSGLFAVIALAGFAAITYTLVPRGASDILPAARAERSARQFENAKIHYLRALQLDGKNPAIHEEMASMFADWMRHASPEKQAELRAWRLSSLAESAKHGKTRKEPRRELLAASMGQDEIPESLHWARELLQLDPTDPDSNYVIASESLDLNAPVLPEVRRHLAALEAANGPEVRIAWVRARLAQVAGDLDSCRSELAKSRSLTLPKDADPADRTALIRLRALDAELTSDPTRLGDHVRALQTDLRALLSGAAVAPNRIMRLSLVLEKVQRSLSVAAAKLAPPAKGEVNRLVDSIEEDVEGIFKRATKVAGTADLHLFLTYADHLRFRGKRERCREVVAEALKSPLTARPASADVVMGLHAVAVEAALADQKDPKRVEGAAPHIKELIACASPRFQGLGHLFQGAVELEQAGIASAPANDAMPAASPTTLQPKLRTSALNHLQIAAAQLPDVVEAQARYGVALVLSQEPGLGRQYLQNAMRLGGAEPQYQLWAAWSMVQAGYPEEAEPIVTHLSKEMAQGRVTRELEGTLHLLSGEVLQARRSPDDLKKALAEYEKSAAGQTSTAAVQLRMAQIEVQLGQSDRALKRIAGLRSQGQGGTAAEHLAVLTLMEQGKSEEAIETLRAARKRYPESEELVSLHAALLAREKKPREADRLLAEFLTRQPDNLSVVLMRAQVQAELLDDPKAARKLLVGAADRSENSAPLVQLALLDMREKAYDHVPGSIAKIRARWKEAAAADLLDAQFALEQGRLSDAVGFFDAALKKDPGNKLVQFWKAQIETRIGSPNEAAKAFEALAREGSSKQLDSGLSLPDAARSALAHLALRNGNVDDAIRRFENLRAGGNENVLARGDRWQLIAAYAAKGQWTVARKEIALLLNDSKSPPTDDERVRAANFYRLNHETEPAIAQLDYVLQVHPAQPAAVVTRSYMLWESKKPEAAVSLLRKAIAGTTREKPPAVFYLMLAALENVSPPAESSATRANAALDQGLVAQPKAPELVRAKYRLLSTVEGPKAAVSFVEAQAKDDPKGVAKRLLAEVYREQQNFGAEETTLRELLAGNPNEPSLAAALVRASAVQAARASEQGDRETELAFQKKTDALIREYRAKFPAELVFIQEDCELAYRRGEAARALAITREIDKAAQDSPVGPLLRARIFAVQGRTRDVADAYNEALRRNPSQSEVRLLLGQTSLQLGEVDEALRQARLVQESEKDRVDALLLEAKALARRVGSPTQTASNRSLAIERLEAAIKKQPKLPSAYHQIAEIRLQENRRDDAVSALRGGFAAVPEDSVGLAQLVELLASPVFPAKVPEAAMLRAANELADTVGKADKAGNLSLALAVGFHKADQLDSALGWVEKAAAKLDSPVVHLNYGDILLSVAEREKGEPRLAAVRRAVEQYDLVLKTQANSVEAVNNKAWLLHTYLGDSKTALDVLQRFLVKVDASTLPGEFFDTLGSIQDALGKSGDAEDSFTKGLQKNPDHPVLNLHMGKLMLGDVKRSSKAAGYLEKALAGRSRMTQSMAAEVAPLLEKTRGGIRGN